MYVIVVVYHIQRKFQAPGQKIFCKLAVEVTFVHKLNSTIIDGSSNSDFFLLMYVQTYVMAGLHRKIFKEVCFIVAQKVGSRPS